MRIRMGQDSGVVSTRCDDECGWKGVSSDTNGINDCGERVAQGELMATGECPICGALISVDDRHVPEYTILNCIDIAIKRGILK